MPLRLTAGTVPGGDAAARACEEERRQGRRLRVRPAGAGRAAAACRRRHRGQSSVSAPYCYLIKHGRARQIKADAAACVSWLAVRESICPKEEGVGGCGACGGAGWVLCDFCQGKKNNVKSETGSRVYRRCPTCKAVSKKDYLFASPPLHLFRVRALILNSDGVTCTCMQAGFILCPGCRVYKCVTFPESTES